MSRPIIAIDIRNTSLAAVVLNAGLKSSTIEACAHVSLPEDTLPEERLAEGISALVQSGIPENATVVASLPADQTIFRTVFVPFKEEKKIRQVLPFELEPNLPFSVENLLIDYLPAADPEKTGLLATAVDRPLLEKVVSALSSANLRPHLVVPGGVPLALALMAYDTHLDYPALLLGVGARRSTLVALQERRIVLVRSLASDISSDQAVEALALRIRQTLTGFADSQPDGFTPRKLYLSGMVDGPSAERLAAALGMPLQQVDVRSIAPKLDASSPPEQWDPALFDSALALALIEAEGRSCPNFHSSSSSFKKYWNSYRPYLQVPAMLLAAVLLLSLGGVLFESHMLKNQVDQINAQIDALFASTFPQTRRVGSALEQMISEIKKVRGGAVDPGQTESQIRTIEILFQLSQLIPKDIDVVFSRLVLGNDGLTISGETSAFNAVDDIKSRLGKSELFKQVTISSADMNKAGNKVQFKLKIDL